MLINFSKIIFHIEIDVKESKFQVIFKMSKNRFCHRIMKLAFKPLLKDSKPNNPLLLQTKRPPLFRVKTIL